MMEEMQKAKYGDMDLDENLEFLQKAMKGANKNPKPGPKVGKRFKEDEDDDSDMNPLAQFATMNEDISSNPHNPYEAIRNRYQRDERIHEEPDEGIEENDLSEEMEEVE